MSKRFLAIALLFAIPLTGQGRTFIVDANMGTGYHFKDIPAAINAAKHGDTLHVRTGSYSSAYLTKGLTILCASNVEFDITIHLLPLGRTAVVKDVAAGSVFVRDSLGRILLDGVKARRGATTWATCNVWQSSDVHLQECKLDSLSVWRGIVTATRCDVDTKSLNGRVGFDASLGILAACDIQGGTFYGNARSAVSLTNRAIVTITDDGSRSIRMRSDPRSSAPTLFGDKTSTLVLDPRVRLVTANATAPKVSAVLTTKSRTIPVLTASGAPPGGTVKVRFASVARDLYAVAVGTLGTPIPVQGFEQIFWLEASKLAVVLAGTLDGTGTARLDVPVPNDPVLLGRMYAWQGIAGTATRGFGLSNPVAYVHGF